MTATSVADGLLAVQLDGTMVSGLYAGGSFSCVFMGNSCNVAGLFSVAVGSGGADVGASVWTITNTSLTGISSVAITLKDAAFNPCVVGVAITTTNVGCASTTPGAGSGLSVSSGGGGGGTASAVYANQVQIGSTVYNDLYNQVTLTFSGGFNPGTFTFLADADALLGASAPTGGGTGAPEPATFGLVGAVLGGLAWRLRRRKTA